MEFLGSMQERDVSITDELFKTEVLTKVTIAMSEKDTALRFMKAVADVAQESETRCHNWKTKESSRASGVGGQSGHLQGSDRDQTRDE
jgi:hypothetical protein